MPVWRCLLSSMLVAALCACAGGARRTAPAEAGAAPTHDEAPACRDYVAAWVANFRQHVATMSRARSTSQTPATDSPALRQAREALHAAGLDDAACRVPYCIIRPLGDGRLDSYCGYREMAPDGVELYRWIPYR